MRKGEKGIIGSIIVIAVLLMGYKGWQVASNTEIDPGIPYYTTADEALKKSASKLMRDLNCRDCHSIWAVRDMMQNVPAPKLDGLGSLYDEEWFYNYFSAEKPQSIVSSRLKPQYRMPSYAQLSEKERRILSTYMSSLKVEDWYLEETKKAEYEKLTGNEYQSKNETDKTNESNN